MAEYSERRDDDHRRRVDDIMDRRLGCLEASDKEISKELQTLIGQVTSVSSQLDGLPDRLRALELEVVNTRMVTKAMTFLGTAVVGSALIMVMTFLFGGN